MSSFFLAGVCISPAFGLYLFFPCPPALSPCLAKERGREAAKRAKVGAVVIWFGNNTGVVYYCSLCHSLFGKGSGCSCFYHCSHTY